MITFNLQANSRHDDFEILQKAREQIEIIWLDMRLLKDLEQVGTI